MRHDKPDPAVDALWRSGTPTDKDLACLLPTLLMEQRIEAVIRKYIGGAVSVSYDGKTNSGDAAAEIAAYLMRKLKPWLTQPGAAGPERT